LSVYGRISRNRRQAILPKTAGGLECLATHRFAESKGVTS
jgi:hypothetical protein